MFDLKPDRLISESLQDLALSINPKVLGSLAVIASVLAIGLVVRCSDNRATESAPQTTNSSK